VQAVTLILKHATLLRTSNLPEAALTNVDLDYQRENIDESIQQYLATCASGVSVEQFVGFIMGTEIGWFILLLFVTSISYCPFSVISVLSHYRCINDTCHRCPGYTFLFQNQHCKPHHLHGHLLSHDFGSTLFPLQLIPFSCPLVPDSSQSLYDVLLVTSYVTLPLTSRLCIEVAVNDMSLIH
jgi:hypothetical protein